MSACWSSKQCASELYGKLHKCECLRCIFRKQQASAELKAALDLAEDPPTDLIGSTPEAAAGEGAETEPAPELSFQEMQQQLFNLQTQLLQQSPRSSKVLPYPLTHSFHNLVWITDFFLCLTRCTALCFVVAHSSLNSIHFYLQSLITSL